MKQEKAATLQDQKISKVKTKEVKDGKKKVLKVVPKKRATGKPKVKPGKKTKKKAA